MKIIITVPPNYKQIVKKFGPVPNAVFTWGDTIYNPGGGEIHRHLEEHETTHFFQQEKFRNKFFNYFDKDWHIKRWWRKYIKDPKFRLAQEVEAYHNQYAFVAMQNKKPYVYVSFLDRIATDLSSKMYDNLCTYDEAIKLIRGDLPSWGEVVHVKVKGDSKAASLT